MPLTDRKFWTLPRLIVVGVVLAVLGVAVWLPSLVDARAVVDIAIRAVKESTGRSLEVKGPVSVRLWPRLSVVAEDVHLGNAPWATDPEMATARRLALSLDWLPLLHQAVAINQAELDGLALNLQPGNKAADGAGNWDFTQPTTGSSDTGDQSAFRIEKIQVNDVSVQVRDRKGDITDGLSIDRAVARFSGDSVSFKGGVVWRQQPLNLQGKFEYPDKQPSSLTLSVDARTLDLRRQAAAATPKPATPGAANHLPFWQDDRPIDYSGLPQMNVQIDLSADQLLLPNGINLPKVNLQARLSDNASGHLSLERFESGFGKGKISASGTINGFAGQSPALSLKAQADGFEIAKLFSIQNLKTPSVSAQGGVVQVDVDLTASGRSPKQLMASLAGHAHASVGAGSLTFNQGDTANAGAVALQSFAGQADFTPGRSPRFSIDLNASKINLERPETTNTASGKAKETSNQRWLFGTDVLPFNQIPLMNGQINLAVTSLVMPSGIDLPNFVLKASMHDAGGGVMQVNELKSTLGQGELMADGMISQYTTANPGLRLRGHVRNFRLDHLIAQMDQKKKFGQVQGGQGEVAFHFTGQGNTLRALVSGMNGEFQFSVDKVTLPRSLVNSSGDFLLSVINTVNPLASKSAVSQIECAVGYLPVRNGLLSIDNSVGIETDQLDVVLSGQVNLKQEQLNINIQTAQKSGLTTGLNTAGLVVVQGTLLNPSLGVNKTGVVKQAATVGLAVVTSGISLAAQNVMSVATKTNPCQNVLKPWSSIDEQLMAGAGNAK